MIVNYYHPNTIPQHKIINFPKNHHDYRVNLKKLQEGFAALDIKNIVFDVFIAYIRCSKYLKWPIPTIGTWSAKFIDTLMPQKKIKMFFFRVNGQKHHKTKFRLILTKITHWTLTLYLHLWNHLKCQKMGKLDGKRWIWLKK